jgi:hypothetical protein
MLLMGLGALLVLGGLLYMARAAIWRGSLSGPDSSRPVRDTLEPPRRGVRFLGRVYRIRDGKASSAASDRAKQAA